MVVPFPLFMERGKAYLNKGADFLNFTGGVLAQPGNMTLVSYMGDIPIPGIPGAAISRPSTLFDVLLPRIFAGDRITREYLISLADGGFCQNC